MSAATWICPSDPPNYYLKILHLIGLISIPINALCLYLVWFHTPKDSKFRYCLAYLQIIAFLVEIDMSWICPGYYLFPMLGGYNIAATNKIFSGHQNTVFGSFKLCFELPSLLLCFLYRQNAAAELDQKFKISKSIQYFVIFTCHTFPFLIAFCLLKSELSGEEMLRILEKNYPKCIHVLNHQGFVLYDPRSNLYTSLIGLFSMTYISIFSIFGGFLGFHTIYILRKVKIHLSSHTYSVHKSAMINLFLQCLVPFICLIIPFNFIFYVVYNDLWKYQEFSTCLIFIMAAHSMISSMMMILTNRRFLGLLREKVFKIPERLLDTLSPYRIPVDPTAISPITTVLAPI